MRPNSSVVGFCAVKDCWFRLLLALAGSFDKAWWTRAPVGLSMLWMQPAEPHFYPEILTVACCRCLANRDLPLTASSFANAAPAKVKRLYASAWLRSQHRLEYWFSACDGAAIATCAPVELASVRFDAIDMVRFEAKTRKARSF